MECLRSRPLSTRLVQKKFDMLVIAQERVYIFHMVGMIVGQKDSLHMLHIDTVGGKSALYVFRSDSDIYDDAPFGRTDIAAVAARSASERAKIERARRNSQRLGLRLRDRGGGIGIIPLLERESGLIIKHYLLAHFFSYLRASPPFAPA